MASSEIKITGLDELQRQMDQLTARVQGLVMRGGLRAGAKVMADEAKRLCPIAPPSFAAKYYGASAGQLMRSIRIAVRAQRGTVTAKISAGNKAAFYAHWVEFGTASHWIRPKNRRSLFIAGLFKEAIEHPGAQRKPFMRPALDSKAQLAVEAMADYLRQRLPAELAKP